MITQIDVRGVLARVVPDHLTDLVTRPTGRAVRSSIEEQLARLAGRTVVVLDFTAVRIIDCSCADEIVAKLVAASLADAGRDAFFLVRGLTDEQIDDVEVVLTGQRLALVAETSGALRLLGEVDEPARLAFARLATLGEARPEDVAHDLAWSLEKARAALDGLAVRRLVMRDAGCYRPLTAA